MNYPRYPEYKPSGVEWLGEVPVHWGLKRLKFATACINDKQDVLPEGLEYVAMENIESWTGKHLAVENGLIPESQTNRFRQGDVLFGKLRPYLAKAWLADRNGVCSTELLVLRERDLEPAYLRYWTLMQSFVEIVDGSTYGSKMPRASWDFIGNVPALIPERNEQRAIAAFLDRETTRIDALIARKQQLIELLAEKRTALISHAVTKGLNLDAPMKDSGVEWLGEIPAHWEAVKGRYIGRLFSSPTVSDDDLSFDGEINYIKVDDLNRDDLSFNLETSRNKVVNDTYNKFAQSGFLLFPKRGAAIFTNKVCIVAAPSLFDPNLMGWRIAQEFCREYMAYVLLARRLDDLADVSTVPQINNKHIYPEKFPAPPKNEQLAIVAHLNKEVRRLNGIGQNVNGAIERLREYRTAIISAAVTGKIDVRESVKKREVA